MAPPVLLNNPFQAPTYHYPADLGSVGQEPYTIIEIRSSVANGQPLTSIALPLPAELTSSYSARYEQKDIYVDRASAMFGQMGQAFDAFTRGQTDVAREKLGGPLGDFVGNLGARYGANDAIERARGFVINPHMANLFKSVPFREFRFSWNFFAKNREETESIKGIIHTLKFAMHPAYERGDLGAQTTFFLYPEQFVIGFFSPSDKYLFKLTPSVLTDLDVNYAGSSVPVFFHETGAPVAIKISATFQETEIITKERIAKGY